MCQYDLTFLNCGIEEWNTSVIVVGKAVYGVMRIQTQSRSLIGCFDFYILFGL